MPRLNIIKSIDEEFELIEDHRAAGNPQMKSATASADKKVVRSAHAVLHEEAQKVGLDKLGAGEAFSPSLGVSRHEREWLFTYLGPFYENQVLVDVLRRVKGGKEANVYVCSAHPSLDLDLLAAKLYRPRHFRNLRNDSRYRAGRSILDERGKTVHKPDALHALAKGSSYGQELRQTSWLQNEYTTIQMLYAAGFPVPKPLATGENAILMEYLGDIDQPAPALNEVTLPRGEARKVFDTLIAAVEGILGQGRIHADLSAYNVLYWEDRPVIIDFPQAIDPRQNPESWFIFLRDVERLCQYFQRYGLRYDAYPLAKAIWDRQNRNFQPEIPLDFSDPEE